MSTLQFPANPVIGDTYDWDAYKYVWDGEKWKTVGIGYNPVNDLKEAITELSGELDPTAEWSAVPVHSDAEISGPMNAQAEALAAREPRCSVPKSQRLCAAHMPRLAITWWMVASSKVLHCPMRMM